MFAFDLQKVPLTDQTLCHGGDVLNLTGTAIYHFYCNLLPEGVRAHFGKSHVKGWKLEADFSKSATVNKKETGGASTLLYRWCGKCYTNNSSSSGLLQKLFQKESRA